MRVSFVKIFLIEVFVFDLSFTSFKIWPAAAIKFFLLRQNTIMKELLISCLVAFIVSCFLMPLMVFISNRVGAVSEVGGRHIGRNPIGRLGGIGVVLGVMFSLLVNFVIGNKSTAVELSGAQLFGLLLGAFVIGGVGFWDDITRLPAKLKLFCQLTGAIIAYSSGLRIIGLDLPLLEPFELGIFGLPITVLWIVGVVNAVNLIDGLDGLAGGVIVLAALVNLVVGIEARAMNVAIIMVAVVGATLGFLIFNWHPAKIYLGDGGAYTLGFLLATCSLLVPLQKATTGVTILVPILAAGLPIFDTTVAIVRRFWKKTGIFQPDRGHLHHLLLDSGISHRKVVVGLYIISCIFCSCAVALVFYRNLMVGGVLLGCSISSLIVWSIVIGKSKSR